MDLIQLCSLAVCTVFCLLLLRRTEPESAMVLRIAAGLLLALAALSRIQPVISAVSVFFKQSGEAGETAAVVLKGVGIGLLTQFAADICRDTGESALAGRVEFVGRVALTVLAVPLFTKLLTLALECIG